MSKITQYLGRYIAGEATDDESVRDYFASDGSVLRYRPVAVVYPRTTDDVRKVLRFSWRMAEKGVRLPITARGYGTDNSGSAIGNGIVVVFPTHQQKVLELDTRQKKIRVQSGMNMRTLNEILATHGLFMPIYPTNSKLSTVGGSIANNVMGPKSVKYGNMRNWVDRLEVILSNGEIIQTGRISKRELNTKMGLQTLEGEIYREVNALIDENAGLIKEYNSIGVTNAGYNLADIKADDGSFDLTPLFVGSQGTLGVISQAILNLAPRPMETALLVAALPSLDDFADIVSAIKQFEPCEFEFIDGAALEYIETVNQAKPLNTLTKSNPEGALIIEFDDGEGSKSKNAKNAIKVLGLYGAKAEIAENQDEKEDIWGSRYSASIITNQYGNGMQPITICDGVVSSSKLGIFRDGLAKLVTSRKIEGFITGRVGVGNLGITTQLDLEKIAGRQAAFVLGKDYYRLVSTLGGSILGDSGDGRLRIEAAREQYGERMGELFGHIKNIFDPKGILNPGVIVTDGKDDLIVRLNRDKSIRFADYRPSI